MKNKVFKTISKKEDNKHNNTHKDKKGMNKNKNIEPYNQIVQKTISKDNPMLESISNKNTTLSNNMKQITNNIAAIYKKNKKYCNTVNPSNITKKKITKKDKNVRTEKTLSNSNNDEGIIRNNPDKIINNGEFEEESITKSENNLIKIKSIKKNILNHICKESISYNGNDSIEGKKGKKTKSKNVDINMKIDDNSKTKGKNENENHQIDILNIKKYNSEASKKVKDKYDKKDSIKSTTKEEINQKKIFKEEISDEIIITESEFEDLKIIQINNLQKTKFPILSVNPFISNPVKNGKNKKDNINNNNNKTQENIINKEKLMINQHTKSSTIKTNNISSTNYSNSSIASSVIEFHNSNSGSSSKKETYKNSTLVLEKNYRDLLFLAKKGDKDKFMELFTQILALPNNIFDINYRDENGLSALHYSCDEGHLKIVKLLLDAKCDPNIKNNEKETPLHLASKRGYFDICKILIENGAILNQYNSENNSPIHYACMNNHVELIKYFLTKDLEVDSKNTYGKTAIDLTKNKEIKELINNYIKAKEKKIKKTLEYSDSKQKNIDSKNSKIKGDDSNAGKKTLFDKKIIESSNKNKFKKNKTSLISLNKSPRKHILSKNNENNSISETIEIKNANLRNNLLKPCNKTYEDNSLDNIQNIKKTIQLDSSINLIRDFKNINSALKKNELNSKEIKKDDTNVNNLVNLNNNNNLLNEIKKTKTKAIVKITSSLIKEKINKTNINNSVNKGYFNLNDLKINNINIKDSINIRGKRFNLSSNKGSKKVNRSFSKNHKDSNALSVMACNQIKCKSKFYKNNINSKNQDSIEITNKNMINLNKTDENIKYIPLNSIQNFIKLETTEKLLTNNKAKKSKKITDKFQKGSNKDSSLVNGCNILNISSCQNRKYIELDKINKSNIVDQTLDNNIHNRLNLNSLEEERITPSSFVCLALLGKGSFGEVYLVRKTNTNVKYAMKVLRKERIMGQNLLKYAIAERNILSLIHHPFIVKLNFAFQTSTKLFLILEYCPNGDLGKHLLIEKRFCEKRAKFYLCEILLALEYLHKKDIIFRDLKPDNIVLDEEGHCKLTDFGLSKEGVKEDQKAQSFCGSLAYLAPEMLKKKGHGKAVDWYLLGVIFYEMLIGVTPFFTLRKEELFHNIEFGELNIPEFISSEAAELLRKLLERDPNKRLGGGIRDAQEIKDHPYFKDVNWDDIYNKKVKPPIFMNYMSNMIHYYHKERLFANEDLFNKASDITSPNKFNGWSFINNENL